MIPWNLITKVLDLFDNYILRKPKIEIEYKSIGTYYSSRRSTREKIALDIILHLRLICLRDHPQYVEEFKFHPSKCKKFILKINQIQVELKDTKPVDVQIDITDKINTLPHKKIYCLTTSKHSFKIHKEDIKKYNERLEWFFNKSFKN